MIKEWCVRDASKQKNHIGKKTYKYDGIEYCNKCSGAIINGSNLTDDEIEIAKSHIHHMQENILERDSFIIIRGVLKHSPVGSSIHHDVGKKHCIGCKHYIAEVSEQNNVNK